MSDDLISRKAVLDILTEARVKDSILCSPAFIEILTQRIKKIPTAFNKEKVIEELKEMATHSASCKNQCEFGSTEYFDYMGAEVAYKTTIEIIEKVGIND